jgi:transposase InsO family protein
MFGDMVYTDNRHDFKPAEVVMPWREVSMMSERKEFVTLALSADRANVREMCRRFGISAPTGYKWLRRYGQEGNAGLTDLSRRPRRSPGRTPAEVERVVLEVRDRHPAWGARKLRVWLLTHGYARMPSPSTITAILKRNGRIDASESSKHTAWQRFERQAPNELWQMDFKGHFAMSLGGRCHPLTVLDDHSRFALGVQACDNELTETVHQRLTSIFRHYGLPDRMLMDNGSPWGTHYERAYTLLTVWLMRLGIDVGHGRPHHPQTQGKDERFHRTLRAEVLQGRNFTDLAQCQAAFDHWRPIYNLQRPHEALGMQTPATRYHVSHKTFPETLAPPEYDPSDLVRRVQDKGQIHFKGRTFRVGKAFRGFSVALRPTPTDGVWDVLFYSFPIAQVDLTEPAQDA